jgi:hypothetical protein
MTASARLRIMAVACVLAASVAVLAATRASATVRKVDAGCQRPAVVTIHTGHHRRVPDSWRGRVFRSAGCGAWRHVHGRHHQRAVVRPAVPAKG